MKILVVTFNDSDNWAIENVVRLMTERGHEVTIFPIFPTEVEMFQCIKGVRIKSLKELNRKTVKNYDVAFTTNMCIKPLMFHDIYVFGFSSYWTDHFATNGADFLFTYCNSAIQKYDFRCASMPVGDPRTDTACYHPDFQSKRILYIDSGHIPYGKKGKYQVASKLLEVCEAFPDYEVCIKPRWLRSHKGNYTHKNVLHIYDVIEDICGGKIPDNLNMLEEHKDISELIDESRCVITLITNAVLNVWQQNKPLIVLDGWENEDKWDARNHVELKDKKDIFAQAGCLVPLDDLLDFLPDGTKAKREVLNRYVDWSDNSSEKILNTIEYVFKNFIAKGKFPKAQSYEYGGLQEIVSDASVSFAVLKQERIRSFLRQRITIFSHKIDQSIDWGRCFDTLEKNYRNTSFTTEEFDDLCSLLEKEKWETLIDHKEVLVQDSINCSFLLAAYYETKKEADLFLFDETTECTSPLCYYRGMICAKHHNEKMAISYLLRYLEECNSRSYAKYMVEEAAAVGECCNYLFKVYNGENISRQDLMRIFINLYKNQNDRFVQSDYLYKISNDILKDIDLIKNEDVELACNFLLSYVQYRNGVINNLKHMNDNLEAKVKTKERSICSILKNFYFAASWKKEIALYPLKIFGESIVPAYKKYCFLKKRYGGSSHFYISNGGIGDDYIAGLYSGDMVSHDDNPVFLTIKKAGKKVFAMFGQDQCEYLEYKERCDLLRMKCFVGNIDVTFWGYPFAYYVSSKLMMAMEGVNGLSTMDLYNALCYEGKRKTAPVFSPDNALIDSFFEKYELKREKTVLLIPRSVSLEPVQETFWELLVRNLKESGYDVLMNLGNEKEKAIKGTIPVLLPVDSMVSLAERCGICISVRCGLLDLIESAKIRHIVLYPKSKIPHALGYTTNSSLLSFSLKNYFGKSDIYEIEYDVTDNQKEKIEEIMRYVLDN